MSASAAEPGNPGGDSCSRKEFFRKAAAGVSSGLSTFWTGYARAAEVLGQAGPSRAWMLPSGFIRPPGARAEEAFLAACTRCSDCIKACPPLAIRKAGPERGRGLEGTPLIIPKENPCALCPDFPCIAACPTGALAFPSAGKTARMGTVVVAVGHCLSERGQPCDLCESRCPVIPKAIRAEPGRTPSVVRETCAGCGQCVQECPAGALGVEAAG